MPGIVVRAAVESDVPSMATALSRAFVDDPVIAWCIPDEANRLEVQRRQITVLTTAAIRRGSPTVLTTDDAVAAAVWVPPGDSPPPPTDELVAALGPLVSSVRADRFLAVRDVEERGRPEEPHWHLATIGTDPDHQRRGIATALMRPVLDRAGALVFLVTQTPANVAFYSARGFVLTGEADLAGGGPHLWLMTRRSSS